MHLEPCLTQSSKPISKLLKRTALISRHGCAGGVPHLPPGIWGTVWGLGYMMGSTGVSVRHFGGFTKSYGFRVRFEKFSC